MFQLTEDSLAVRSPVLETPRLGEHRLPGAATPTVYISHLPVREMFVDYTYQRELDLPRARALAQNWDPRLVGVIDVSDRGDDAPPDRKYAIINGQHRHMAAKLNDPKSRLVVNIHTGLSIREEARLFHQIDASTRRLTTWDRWRSRRAAGDEVVRSIESAAEEAGLEVDPAMRNGTLRCVAQCEKLYRLGQRPLVARTLRTLVDVWGHQADAADAPIVGGLGLLLHHHSAIDLDRLQQALIDEAPRRIKARANALAETEPGSKAKLTALTMVTIYNATKGPKLRPTKGLCCAAAAVA